MYYTLCQNAPPGSQLNFVTSLQNDTLIKESYFLQFDQPCRLLTLQNTQILNDDFSIPCFLRCVESGTLAGGKTSSL